MSKSYNATAVGQRIRQVRRNAGLTQQELADKLGVEQSYISGVELGYRGGSAEFLLRLSSTLGVSMDMLAESGITQTELPENLPQGLAELAVDEGLTTSLLIMDNEIEAMATLEPLTPLSKTDYLQLLLLLRTTAK